MFRDFTESDPAKRARARERDGAAAGGTITINKAERSIAESIVYLDGFFHIVVPRSLVGFVGVL